MSFDLRFSYIEDRISVRIETDNSNRAKLSVAVTIIITLFKNKHNSPRGEELNNENINTSNKLIKLKITNNGKYKKINHKSKLIIGRAPDCSYPRPIVTGL